MDPQLALTRARCASERPTMRWPLLLCLPYTYQDNRTKRVGFPQVHHRDEACGQHGPFARLSIVSRSEFRVAMVLRVRSLRQNVYTSVVPNYADTASIRGVVAFLGALQAVTVVRLQTPAVSRADNRYSWHSSAARIGRLDLRRCLAAKKRITWDFLRKEPT
jgi:hypothetical protein